MCLTVTVKNDVVAAWIHDENYWSKKCSPNVYNIKDDTKSVPVKSHYLVLSTMQEDQDITWFGILSSVFSLCSCVLYSEKCVSAWIHDAGTWSNLFMHLLYTFSNDI